MAKDMFNNRFNLQNGWPILLLIGLAVVVFMTITNNEQTETAKEPVSRPESESTPQEMWDQQAKETIEPIVDNELSSSPEDDATNLPAQAITQAQSSGLPPAEKLVESKKPFTIQVFSFKDKPSAQKTVDGLRKAGHPAYILSKDLKEKGLWHRVCVGTYDTKEEADQYLPNLRNLHKDSFVIATDHSRLRDNIKSFPLLNP